MRRESRMEEQAARIKSIHQEEFLLQSTAIWEQSLERKKEQLCPSQETKGEWSGASYQKGKEKYVAV